MSINECIIILAEFDGWVKSTTKEDIWERWYLDRWVTNEAGLRQLKNKYLSFDSLIPIWKKLLIGKRDTFNVVKLGWFEGKPTCDVFSNQGSNWNGLSMGSGRYLGNTEQEAAVIATAKAVLKEDNND